MRLNSRCFLAYAFSIDPETAVRIAMKEDSMSGFGNIVQMLKQEQDRLTKQMEGVSAALSAFAAVYGKRSETRSRISAAGRARIAAAQKARWAKQREKKSNAKVVALPKRHGMSAEARKKIASAQRARWARIRAAEAKPAKRSA
jgi:hypothetical protein